MYGEVTAIVLAREIMRQRMDQPPPERTPRRPRRAVARVLQTLAHRLDPAVAQAPRTAAG